MLNTKYLIIGGSLAGAYASISIRERDKNGRIILISEENYLPYDKVPLSKTYLQGLIKKDLIFIKDEKFYKDNNIELFLNKKVEKIDFDNNIAFLKDNEEIKYEKVLLATGGYPRKLKVEGTEAENIFYLRTIDDCDKIKSLINKIKKAVIIGGGFIGCEIASSFKKYNIKTTIIEKENFLLPLALDEISGKIITEHFIKNGIDVLTNISVNKIITKNGKAIGVETSDGREIEADIIIIGIGIIPNTSLAENKIKTYNGIVTNEFLRTEKENVFAAGDVANFYHSLFNENMRVEHYDVAVKHGKIAGMNMIGENRKFDELPYFFSYMYKLNIYSWGYMKGYDTIIRRGELNIEKGFLQFYLSKGKIKAVLAVNTLKEVEEAKKLIMQKEFDNPEILSNLNISLKDLS
jgi:NADPH-dependent 2,4-dienoyl-CoA reductase/sulfur reductase-like enzyme